jgi:hypothetical protein
MQRLGLGNFAKRSCPSPFRADTKPSWGIFNRDGHYYFKDFATGDKGDEIELLAKYLKVDSKKDFFQVLNHYQKIADQSVPVPPTLIANPVAPQSSLAVKPDTRRFGPGTNLQLTKLALLRGFSFAAVEWAQSRGLLVFGEWYQHEVFGVTDKTGRVLEIRRLDGKRFEASWTLGERKSHAIKGSQKKWPVGVMEAANSQMILLTEGIPDFLSAHQVIMEAGKPNSVAPVSLLCASVGIAEEALPLFKGKHVRIFPHVDIAGRKAAKKWSEQLRQAGATKVDFYDFARVTSEERIKDLCEYTVWQSRHPEHQGKLV